MTQPSDNMRITEVTVCALPEDHIEHDAYALRVQWRGGETHAVTRMRRCLGTDGEWDFEPSPSNRDDDWIATHRFGYDEALRLAVEAAPHVKVSGHSVADALAAAPEVTR
jgi:hypothetical protein